MNVAIAAGELHGTRGDATAKLTMLYERHWSDLVRHVNRTLSDVHQAEEIAQEQGDAQSRLRRSGG